MRDGDAFWFAGRAGSIQQIGKAVGTGAGFGIVLTLRRNVCLFRVKA